jgi:outer membrane protein assembly factor BamB
MFVRAARIVGVCSLLVALVAIAVSALAVELAMHKSWPTFRGEARTGHVADSGLLQAWPEDGPKLVWKAEGAGRGYASVAIVDGKIYTLGDKLSTADGDDNEYLSCFDQATGKQLWKTKTGEPWNKGQPSWQGSRSTPTVDGDRVYVVTPSAVLVCCKTSGEELWRKDLLKDFEGKKADGWGSSESPLIDGNLLICTPGGPKNTMVALDKMTGDKIWSCAREEDRGAGHSSAVISNIGGTKVYVQNTGSGTMGVRASDGKLLWEFDVDKIPAVIPVPVVRDDLVFFVAGYGMGGALLKQVPGEDGNVSMEVVYPLKKELASKHGGVVLVGDYIYGDSEDRGIPWCADLKTGEVKWKSRGSGKNSMSITAADGHLYMHYADGTMALVKASPEAFEEVGHFTVPGSGDRPSWAHPVVLDGKLYVREGDLICCYDVRK